MFIHEEPGLMLSVSMTVLNICVFVVEISLKFKDKHEEQRVEVCVNYTGSICSMYCS